MNENNPPMMLPNGYVYGYNVSVEISALLMSGIAVVTVTSSIKIRACKLRKLETSLLTGGGNNPFTVILKGLNVIKLFCKETNVL